MTQPWKLKNKMCHGTRTEQLAGCKMYEELFWNIFCCQRSVEESLERLGVDYIDVIQVKQTYQWILNRRNKNFFVRQSKEGSSGNAHIWMSWQKVHDVEFCVSLEQVVKFTLPALAQLKAQGKVRWVTPTRFCLTLKHAVGSCMICDYISPDTLAWLDITWALFNVSSRRHLQAASTRFVITIVILIIIIIFIPPSPISSQRPTIGQQLPLTSPGVELLQSHPLRPLPFGPQSSILQATKYRLVLQAGGFRCWHYHYLLFQFYSCAGPPMILLTVAVLSTDQRQPSLNGFAQ